MATTLNWGILGAGNIAKSFARALPRSVSGRLVAVGSRDPVKAEAFAKEFNAARAHGSYEALLADPSVEAVYIATPHPMHAEWAIRAAEAKKHILCEKPLALNHAEAMAMVEAARAHDVFLMEAFMYRCHPQTRRLVELLREGAIGEVRMVQAAFGFNAGYNPESRLFANALGGGGILDVGCYAVSMARLIAGVVAGRPFADPQQVVGAGHLLPTGVDGWAAAVLRFAGGFVAQVSTSVQLNQENVVRIYGADGWILVPSPWVPARDGGQTTLIVHRKGESQPREVLIDADRPIYAIEADTVAQFVEKRQAESPAMSWDDSLGNMKALDAWREQVGLLYEAERPENLKTVHRRPLAVRAGHNMKYGRIRGVDKPVSRLIMGVDNITHPPHIAVMFDDFFERGGNAFDTAYIYGGGRCEKALGGWVRSRGLRDKVVLLGKGAHTPDCQPEKITQQLAVSLERLGTDYLDIYMMHRDNPDVPVGEFVDVLNEHLSTGRIRSFGGSNWSLRRVEEANAWARKKGLAGFAAISNNLSLAEMVDPIWAGCIHVSDPQSRAWLEKTQTPVLSWSSQARGFFLEGVDPADRSNRELARCWFSDANFRRRERAFELAKKKGVLPINVALAYVLCQPFPTFALIGPRALWETRTSLPALDVLLTPDEIRWLWGD